MSHPQPSHSQSHSHSRHAPSQHPSVLTSPTQKMEGTGTGTGAGAGAAGQQKASGPSSSRDHDRDRDRDRDRHVSFAHDEAYPSEIMNEENINMAPYETSTATAAGARYIASQQLPRQRVAQGQMQAYGSQSGSSGVPRVHAQSSHPYRHSSQSSTTFPSRSQAQVPRIRVRAPSHSMTSGTRVRYPSTTSTRSRRDEEMNFGMGLGIGMESSGGDIGLAMGGDEGMGTALGADDGMGTGLSGPTEMEPIGMGQDGMSAEGEIGGGGTMMPAAAVGGEMVQDPYATLTTAQVTPVTEQKQPPAYRLEATAGFKDYKNECNQLFKKLVQEMSPQEMSNLPWLDMLRDLHFKHQKKEVQEMLYSIKSLDTSCDTIRSQNDLDTSIIDKMQSRIDKARGFLQIEQQKKENGGGK